MTGEGTPRQQVHGVQGNMREGSVALVKLWVTLEAEVLSKHDVGASMWGPPQHPSRQLAPVLQQQDTHFEPHALVTHGS